MDHKKIIDISLAIGNDMVVYPNNPPTRVTELPRGTTAHSLLEMGTHNGTHVDAPRHVFADGRGLNNIPLERYIGTCRVLDFTKVKECITKKDFERYDIKKGDRILAKTSNSKRGFKTFYDDYVYLDGDAADYLAKRGISLFGIDYLSVKKRGGEDQRPHTSLLKKGIVIFEGLDLSKAMPGTYMFIGLPLKLGNIDAAPARAVLIKK